MHISILALCLKIGVTLACFTQFTAFVKEELVINACGIEKESPDLASHVRVNTIKTRAMSVF